MDSAGHWLNQPDALMKGTTGGHPADALLILSRPLYNETEQVLFLPRDKLHLKAAIILSLVDSPDPSKT